MKSIFICFLGLVYTLTLANEINSDWEQWKIIHKRSYSIVEDKLRREIFKANAERIASHNRLFDMGLTSYRLGINRFSDMTASERSQQFLGLKPISQTQLEIDGQFKSNIYTPSGKTLPDSIDWRDHNVVTKVKDQGHCGSCFAFSTTGSVEGQHALATGELVSLSEQQIVDCTNTEPYDNAGCGYGGFMNNSLQYIKESGGIVGEEDYPYKAVDEACQYDKKKVKATVTGYVNIKQGSEQDLQDAVANIGPISVAIHAFGHFDDYSGGIYDGAFDCTGSLSLNHAVLVVGYGSEDGKDYYIVKNSMGPSWGENGYIRMIRNMDDRCGIALAALYPTVK